MNTNPGCLGVFLKLFNQKKDTPELSYQSAGPLLSEAEKLFYTSLQTAFGQTYWIYPKVRLADLIKPTAKPRTSEWHTAFNKIKSKHVDFVVCHPESFDVVAVFELDDASHERRDRKDRDAMVDQALSSCGIAIHHIKATNQYDAEALAAMLNPPLQ
jgi:uncharacterized protein with GYD domain